MSHRNTTSLNGDDAVDDSDRVLEIRERLRARPGIGSLAMIYHWGQKLAGELGRPIPNSSLEVASDPVLVAAMESLAPRVWKVTWQRWANPSEILRWHCWGDDEIADCLDAISDDGPMMALTIEPVR